MDLRWLLVIPAFAILTLVYAAFALHWENLSLERQLSDKNAELSAKVSELDSANAENARLNYELNGVKYELMRTNASYHETLDALMQTRSELQSAETRLAQTEEELENSRTQLNETRSEMEGLLDEVYELEDSINSSIQWFKDNSALPSSSHLFMAKVENSCVKGGKVNLGCIHYLMDEDLEFEYISESPDRLYSVYEMLEKKNGGDCEDFSLLLKAILSEIKGGGRSLDVEAWEYAPGQEYTIYEKGDTYWYIEGYGKELADLSESTPYVICFTTGVSGDALMGHCIVALSEKEVNSVSEVQNLEGAQAFEPQDGSYVGGIGEGKYLRVCEEGDSGCEYGPGNVHFIISNNDLYQFSGGQWKNYALYYDSVETLEERLEGALGE